MRLLGWLLKLVGSMMALVIIIATVICFVVPIELPELYYYVIIGAIWICAWLVTLTVLGTGIALTAVSKLKKKNKLLEQRVENLLLAQVSAYRAPTVPPGKPEVAVPIKRDAPAENMDIVTPAEEPVAITPSEVNQIAVEDVTSVSEKPNIKKWIWVAVIGGIILILLFLLLLVNVMKTKLKEQLQQDVGIVLETDRNEQEQEESVSKKDKPKKNAVPVEIGESIDNELFTMSFDSMEILDEYKYQVGERSSRSLYVEDGYKLLIVKGLFVNNYTTVIENSCFALEVTVNDSYVLRDNDVRFSFERSSDREIDPYTEQQYIMYINIPEKLAENFRNATFTIGYNDDLSDPYSGWDEDGNRIVEVDRYYSITSDIDVVNIAESEAAIENEEAMPIEIGDTICTDAYEFTLTDVKMSYNVLPSDTSSVYTSYPAESGKVYIDVKATVKNTMQRDIRIEELFKTSSLYDGKYPYKGFTVVDDGNSFDWLGSYVAATPLETCIVHSIIECPVEVDNSGKPVVVYIELGDSIFEYSMR